MVYNCRWIVTILKRYCLLDTERSLGDLSRQFIANMGWPIINCSLRVRSVPSYIQFCNTEPVCRTKDRPDIVRAADIVGDNDQLCHACLEAVFAHKCFNTLDRVHKLRREDNRTILFGCNIAEHLQVAQLQGNGMRC